MLSSFVLNDSGSSSTSPSRLPRMLVEYQPFDAEQPRLEAGRDERLHQVWPVLRSLPAIGAAGLRRQLQQRRDVGAEVRRRVRVGDPLVDRGVRVDHARRDRVVARLEPLLERLDAGVDRRLLQKDLGAAAPDHHQPVAAVLLLEAAHVFDELFGEVLLVLALLDVRPVEPLDVAAVEDRGHRRDRFELGPDLLEQVLVEHAGMLRRFVGVVVEDVPRTEHDVVERGERHEVLDERRAAVRPLAETDRAHLRQRADRLRESLADREHARDGGRADRSHPDQEHPELAPGICDVSCVFHSPALYHREIGGSGFGDRGIGEAESPKPRAQSLHNESSC